MGESLSKRKIVISAVNLFQGGPLTILNDNLKFLNDNFSNNYEIVALIHSKHLFNLTELNKIKFIEFPKSLIDFSC